MSEKSPEAEFYEDPAPHPVMEKAAIDAVLKRDCLKGLEFTIEGQVRSKKNSKQIFCRGRHGRRFITSSLSYKDWARLAVLQVRAQRAGAPTFDASTRVRVSITLYHGKGRRMDRDNARAGIFDVLEEAGVIENDGQIWEDPLTILRDVERPRVEIEVTPIVAEE